MVLSVSPRRWNGHEDPVPVGRRDARAPVDDPDLDPVAERLAVTQRRRARRASSAARWRRGWRAPARAARGRRGPRAGPRASVERRRRRRRRRGRRGRGPRPRRRRRAAGAIDSAPACSRLMSSRLSTRPREPVQGLVRGLRAARPRSSSARSTSWLRRLETDGLGRGQGVRRSWPTAASRAVRILLASASGRGLGGGLGQPQLVDARAAACAAKAPTSRWSSASQHAPAQRQHELLADAGTSVSAVAGPGRRPGRRVATARVQPRLAVAFEERDRRRARRSPGRRCEHARAGAVLAAQHAAGEVGQRVATRPRARAACRVRRAARSTTELTSAATSDEDERARAALLVSSIVSVCRGGVK